MENLNLFCKYCGNSFSKENKPHIMNCSHNICSKCLKLNNKILKCLECETKFMKNKIKKFPINFLLLELCSSKEEDKNKKENENKFYFCEICNLNLSTDYHKKNYPTHNLIEKEKDINENIGIEIEKKKAELLNEFLDINRKSVERNALFFGELIKRLKDISTTFKFDDIDPFEILLLSGIINPADKERLKFFNDKIFSNEENKNIFLNSKNFDDLIQNLNNRK
ncbi:MAG: RING finger protein, partial [archaeon]|nr:RING finger protein [archaeon]